MRSLLLFAALLPAAGLHAQSPAPDPLAPFDFLLGTWSAKSTGGGAQASTSGTYTFRRDLGGHAFERTSSADTCHAPAAFDCQHHDRLTLFSDPDARAAHGSSLLGFYMDSEGHVIYYVATLPEPHTLVLTSQAADALPHIRLTYHLAPDGTLTGSFAIASSATSEYRPYLAWTGQKLSPP